MSEEKTLNALTNYSMSPVVVSTWNHGLSANAKALEVLGAGGDALDAAEAGVMVTELDSLEHSVGLSGFPDRDGIVTLDAAIMDHTGRAGSVAPSARSSRKASRSKLKPTPAAVALEPSRLKRPTRAS